MSRDNHLRSNDRRSRSPQDSPRFRNNALKSSHRSPPYRRYRERSRSIEKNGHRAPTPTDIRRKNPEPSKVLGVFNLHVRTTESEIRDVFERFGQIDDIIMIKDAKTRGFRGYCFIYYNKQRDATEALNQCNGTELKERMIRVDYSLSERPHQSTPGEYRGKRGRLLSGSGRPRPYERSRYYDRQDRYRHRSSERSYRDRKDDYKRRSRERPLRRSVERHRRRSTRSPRDRYDRY